MNLVTNGIESIQGEGVITIKTENRYISRPIIGYDEVEEGDYVSLIVNDTGQGIADKDLERIFEPFFTKKQMGRSYNRK
jgi:signal transduction histidine kinase